MLLALIFYYSIAFLLSFTLIPDAFLTKIAELWWESN